MKDFEELSKLPWFLVNPETGELDKLDFKKAVGWKGKYIIPSYSQTVIDAVRLITSPLWEKVLCKITGGKKVKQENNKGYDILLPNWDNLEAKVWRIGNSAVIKRNQLDYLGEDDYYGIVFYRTTENKPPSYFIAQKETIDEWIICLKRNISLEAAFLFPKPIMVHYYNTSNLVEWIISSTWIHHKPIAYARALDLFEEWNNGYNKESYAFNYQRHRMQVYSLGDI